ncbi:MAG: VanW family protein [Lachnospiraceae bacterium]
MKKFKVLGSCAVMMALGIAMALPVYAKEKTIPEGISVGDFSLGGMTRTEAEQQVKEYIKGMEGQKITLDIDGDKAQTTAKELGFYWSNTDAVDEATDQVFSGNLVQQYMGIKDLQKTPVCIPLETSVDADKVESFVNEYCEGVMDEPQNATITREEGRFVVTPGVSGKVVNIEATKQALDDALAGGLDKEIVAQAVVTTEDPVITEADLNTIQDVLGTFSTDFSSSGASRSKNLQNGAAKINGHVLMPGETLSGYELMHPFTTANGYFTAAAYENGQVVDSVGGGVCQIATTLYNTALLAELEITQRQNHSMIVTYVKPSMDAAIAGTFKDIKFTNNYSTPIYVEGGTNGRTLTFTIYGKETRPANREIKYVSETLSVSSPGAPTEKVDNSLAPGARKQVQSAHKGIKSRLWKCVYIDGVETEKILLHTDNYNASKAIVLVGPAQSAEITVPVETVPAETQPTLPTTPAETEPERVEGINGGPGVTSPAQTEAAPAPTEAAPAPTEAAPAPAPATPAPEATPAPAEAPVAGE